MHSSMSIFWSRFSGVIAVLTLASPLFAQKTPSFRGLGDFPDGIPSSRAHGISGDGRVVVGNGSRGAFRWTEDEGLVELASGPSGRSPIVAYDASFDGSVIVGIQDVPNGASEAFRWTESTGAIGLGDFDGGILSSFAYGTANDGSVVVGRGVDDEKAIAFRWTEADGRIPPGGVFPEFSTEAWGVSADGSVVVGAMFTAAGREAFRWTEETGYVGLGDLPGGEFRSHALAVSADGSVIVGWSESLAPNGESQQQMFRWTEEDGMVGLGFLQGSNGLFGHGQALGVSADGSVIVGDVFFIGAVIWDEVHGLRNLEELLSDDYGLAASLSDWNLSEATGISADGTVIVGWGRTVAFDQLVEEAWVAVIPEPASLTLCTVGMGCCLVFFRLRRMRRIQ